MHENISCFLLRRQLHSFKHECFVWRRNCATWLMLPSSATAASHALSSRVVIARAALPDLRDLEMHHYRLGWDSVSFAWQRAPLGTFVNMNAGPKSISKCVTPQFVFSLFSNLALSPLTYYKSATHSGIVTHSFSKLSCTFGPEFVKAQTRLLQGYELYWNCEVYDTCRWMSFAMRC